ncbi:MAG: T9SS type A sorting domain-containing protein [Bacteroidota bacterium]|nr:T9SS type A sorting domain-containing protein [Bacteroidota bacterium]MDX5430833.1 T9SS type A sorting domain-containing protein [Bacteroidota bacterium]MDX5469577.1 T9SS type A sorting domain-containing protein [Bacteroidota bacterium]
MKNLKFWMTAVFASATFVAGAQTVVEVTDASINQGETVNWTKNNVYLITEPVFVEDGATLNIEAGTVIKGKAGVDAFLTIARGGKINATGTAEEPIIFTAEADDVNDPTDLGPDDIGLWGGIVICGKAKFEKDGLVEAQSEGVAGTEPRALYGGTDDNDNSGTLRYVSVRHAGFELGSGDELNGISFCAVGAGTTVEYVEVYANKDDGMEFFGGTVNVKYAVVAFCRDDAFDWDEGYRGKGQFWFAIQSNGIGDCIGELDGAIPDGGARYSDPVVYNWTGIGPGQGGAAAQTIMILQRDATAGKIKNSIFTQGKQWAWQVEDLGASKGVDSYQRLADGQLVWESNLIYDFGAGNTLDTGSLGLLSIPSSSDQPSVVRTSLIAHFNDNNNKIADPGLKSVSRIQDNNLDPRPSGAEVTTNIATIPNDPFFTQVNYKGAFSSTGPQWINGWSTLDRNDHLAAALTSVQTINVISTSIYPNPSNGQATLTFELKENDNVVVSIVNISGQVVNTLNLGNLNAGSNSVNIDSLPAGAYFVNVKGENGQATLKLIVQ